MIYIYNLTKVTETKYNIGCIHYQPFSEEYGLHKSREELEKEGVFFDSLPELEHKEGFEGVFFYNPVENKLFYEYLKVGQQSKQPTVEDLQRQLETTSIAIAELSTLIMGKQ